jgi:integrase/recombinase XerD
VFDDVERDITAVQLPSWGRVAEAAGVVPWLVFDDAGQPIGPIKQYLADFMAQGNSAASARSYGFELLRWWRWLMAVDVEWHRATPAEGRDLVLWLMRATKPIAHTRSRSRSTAGMVNPITGKRSLGDRYGARTIRHSNAVIRAFYEYWIELGLGPLVNPMPLDPRGRRANAYHDPAKPFRPEGRIRYNPKLPKAQPRELRDEHWLALFGALRSDRDRALLSLTLSNGARAAEILGVRIVDLDWGDQLIRVVRKGSRAEQWLPASPDAFVWLRLYLADLAEPLRPQEPLWWTLRQRDRGDGLKRQPMSYDALRKVVTRANDDLGTNWTMHDLRHTCALRMSRNDELSARDIQTILGHAHLSTTVDTYLVEDQAEVVRRVARHLIERERQPFSPQPNVAAGYDATDLAILLGLTPR